MTFFATAAAAERAGFRPCLRCRPEAAPGTPAWRGADARLRRLFLQHAGASPRDVAGTRRVQRAKRLLTETVMPIAAVAFAAGFTSIRRFNAAFRAVYRRPPSAIRARRRPSPGER